jgi:GrpB-like predicted nucleotidyltransferase (UPF0157 family)
MRVEVVKHSPYWKLEYKKEEQRILKSLKLAKITRKIAHIGSTSVSGLSAKPTIDILLGLSAETDLDDCISMFKKLGYIYISKYNDMTPFRRFFIKISASNLLQKFALKEVGENDNMPLPKIFKRDFHIHVVYENTLFYEKHIAFRNHLRSHEADRIAYENLKLHLSQLDWQDGNDYAQAKSGFITNVMMKLGFV